MFFFLVLCAFSSAIHSESFRFRDIFDTSFIGYNDDTRSIKVENVFLYKLTPNIIPEFRMAVINMDYGPDGEKLTRMLFQLGSVVIFAPNVYGEFVYGVWRNSDASVAQEGFAELIRETDTMLASFRIKGGYDHGSGILYLIPDASYKYQFNSLYSAKVKYFFGYNTDSFISHSLQVENGFAFLEKYTATAITTGVFESIDGEDAILWSAGVRLEAIIKKPLTVKYIIQYHNLRDERWGLENGIAVDWRF
jgi:hypothetical protein